MKRLAYLSMLAATLTLTGCGGGGGSALTSNPDPVRASVADAWMTELVSTLRVAGSGPTPNSRSIALVTTAMYDAMAILDPTAVAVYTGDERFQSLGITPPADTPANRDKAVAMAAYRTMLNLFPSRSAQLTALAQSQGLDTSFTAQDLTRPEGVGNMAATNLIDDRRNDGSNQAGGYADTTGYKPVNTETTVVDIDKWQPLRFVFPDGTSRVPGWLTPHWNQVRPFALKSASEFRCPPPVLSRDAAAFRAQAEEVLQFQRNLTEEQKMIAEYWAGGPGTETPPGLWVTMAKHVANQHNMDDKRRIKTYMLVGNAVLDAGISCWDSKIVYDSVRPITAIRQLYAGQTITAWGGPGRGNVTMDGSQWKPYQPDSFITPPFAEIPSGHSTFSSAAAEVLRRFTGSDQFNWSVTLAPGSSMVEPGVTPSRPVTLTFPTLSSAVHSAGMSRLYGGIHFRRGCEDGWEMGQQVGDRVFTLASDLFRGVRR